MNEENIIEILKAARRELDILYPTVSIIDDWEFDDLNKKWFLHLSILIDKENEYFPKESLWYIVVEDIYPQGQIKIYPDVNNSIKTTLYHQSNNYHVNRNGLWRQGHLCVELNTLNACNTEPFSIEGRLLFHVKRAIEWLKSAANNHLVSKQELFELPDFNDNKILDATFIFSEDLVTFQQWLDIECKYGLADIGFYKSNPTIYYVKSFYSPDNKPVHITRWGSVLNNNNNFYIRKAIWLLLKEIPTINNWQAPVKLEELFKLCLFQGYDLKAIIKENSRQLRDGHPHLLLLGFPIPKHWFSENEIIFWKAAFLPTLSYGNLIPKGFRNNQKGYWFRDITEVLRSNRNIDWILSENWNQVEISQRGKLSNSIKSRSILLLGTGCIGASTAEILVRSGIYNLTLADFDIFKVGNLSRHTLDLNSIGMSKSSALCKHLNCINPHAEIKSINEKLSFIFKDSTTHPNIDIEKYDIIIDCTGEDSILNIFNSIELNKVHFFASVSIGFGAKRLYINMQKSKKLNFDPFYKIITKYINEDLKNINENDLPRDGIGCWHPTFPARSDDIWEATSIAVKNIEKYVNSDKTEQVSLVYEQKDNIYYEGYTLIDKCEGE